MPAASIETRVSGSCAPAASDEEFLQSIVDVARSVFDAAACSIALLNVDEDELEFRVTSGAGSDSTVGMRMPADRGIAGWALMAGQAIAVDGASLVG